MQLKQRATIISCLEKDLSAKYTLKNSNKSKHWEYAKVVSINTAQLA